MAARVVCSDPCTDADYTVQEGKRGPLLYNRGIIIYIILRVVSAEGVRVPASPSHKRLGQGRPVYVFRTLGTGSSCTIIITSLLYDDDGGGSSSGGSCGGFVVARRRGRITQKPLGRPTQYESTHTHNLHMCTVIVVSRRRRDRARTAHVEIIVRIRLYADHARCTNSSRNDGGFANRMLAARHVYYNILYKNRMKNDGVLLFFFSSRTVCGDVIIP